MITTPKARFQEKPDNIKKHHELIDRPEFRLALDHAMLNFVEKTTVGREDFAPSAAHFYRLQGAKEFVAEFLTLADKGKAVASHLTSNLPSNQE